MKQLVASAVLALSVFVCLGCCGAEEPTAKSASHSTAVAAATTQATDVDLSELSAAGEPGSAVALPSAPRHEVLLVTPATPAPKPLGVAAAPSIPARKVVDKKFLGMGVLVFGATSLDMELTQHCLQRNTCVELNPTLPTSHWGMYATNTPVNAGVMWLAYKRKRGGHRDWWIWPAIDVGVHIYGVTTNYKYAWSGRTSSR